MTNLFDIKGKVALITGSTHGLGMAMAKGLGHAGAKIVVNDHSSQEAVDNAIAEYKAEGIEAYGYLFDVTDALKRAHDYAAEMQLGAEGFDNTQTAGYFNGVRERLLVAATEIEAACRSLLE